MHQPCQIQRATYLGDEHAIASRDAHGRALAVLVKVAGANGQHLGLVELLDARLGEEDAAGRLGLGLDALDQDAVQQRHERADRAEGGGLQQGKKVSSCA